jgi:3-phenylpropionate/trans-cinnamate dioxygenase ferredoxin component
VEARNLTEFVEVAKTNEIAEGTMKKVRGGGRELLVAHIAGRFFCSDNLCPHLGGDLSAGTLNGTVITCPMHHSRFDLSDGHMIRWTDLTGITLTVAKNQRPPRPLRIYPVKVEGDKILAAL